MKIVANTLNSTRPGKHDQANLETIFVPEPAIDVLKPEVLTFEQAPGLIMNQEHRLYFRGLIGGIVRCGYNVRYKIVDLVEYGVPQRRRRLIIIAARYETQT
jgi:DNA (cytosine-5)-methyltransferase 1